VRKVDTCVRNRYDRTPDLDLMFQSAGSSILGGCVLTITFDLTPQPYCSPEPLTQEQLYLQINQILPACHQLVAAPNDKSK